MNRSFLTLLTTLLVPFSLNAAEGLNISIINNAGEITNASIIGADVDGLLLSQGGGNSFKLPLQNVKEYNIEEPKGWSVALATFVGGDYANAEKLFAQLSADYEKLIPLRDSYGSLARLYHFRSLREQGKFSELAVAMDKQRAAPLSLGAYYNSDLVELQGWAWVGKKDWQALETYLKDFQEVDAQKLLPQPAFKDMPPARLAALSFMRGLWNEQQKRPDLANVDFSTAMTVDFGSNAYVTAQATLGCMRVIDGRLQTKPDDLGLKRQACALAVTFRDLSGGGKVPEEFAKYLEKPPEPAGAKKADEATAGKSEK